MSTMPAVHVQQGLHHSYYYLREHHWPSLINAQPLESSLRCMLVLAHSHVAALSCTEHSPSAAAAAAELSDPSSKLSHVLRLVEHSQAVHSTFGGHLDALKDELGMRSAAAQAQPAVQRAMRLVRLAAQLCASMADREQLGWCSVSAALQAYLQQQLEGQQLQQDSASAADAARALLASAGSLMQSAPSTSTSTSTSTSSPQHHSSRMAALLRLLEAKVVGQDNPYSLRIIVLVATQRAAAEVQRVLCGSQVIAPLKPGLLLGQQGLYGMDPIEEQRPAMEKFKSGVCLSCPRQF
jgi:hypothetical protein